MCPLSVFNLVNTDPSVKLQKSTQPSSISKFQQFLNEKISEIVEKTRDKSIWFNSIVIAIEICVDNPSYQLMLYFCLNYPRYEILPFFKISAANIFCGTLFIFLLFGKLGRFSEVEKSFFSK